MICTLQSRNVFMKDLYSCQKHTFRFGTFFNSLKIYFSEIKIILTIDKFGPVGSSCRIRRLHLCIGEGRKTHNECRRSDNQQSDGDASVMLKLFAMQITSLLSLLPGPLWPGVVPTDSLLYGSKRTI